LSELGEVLELMHTSEQRWRSLRAAGREWRHSALNLEAFMGIVERRRPGSVAVFGGSSKEVEEPEEIESTWRLWVEGSNRVRAEFAVGHGETVTAVVDGRTWWSWSPSTGAVTNEGSENAETGLGPGTALVHPALILPAIDLEIRGRTTRLDRSVYQVLAIPESDNEGEENSGLLHGIGSGAEEYELMVDAERGVLIRTEARLHRRPFLILEMDDVAFDEELPAHTFTLAPPAGEAFETLPRSRSLLLEELPGAVSFTILVPERVLEDAQVDVMIESAVPRHGVPEYADITYHTFPGEGPPTFLALRESAGPMPMPDGTEWQEIEEFKVEEDPHTSPPTIRVRVEVQGTHVELSSRDLSLERLLSMARSLVPLPPSPRSGPSQFSDASDSG
jgi:outer membrane lipoprotein-sorting protein